jgi:predicted PurR-regulated permease PerM
MDDVWKRRIRIGMVVVPILLGLYVAWTVRTAILPFVLGTAIAYVIAPAVSWLAVRFPFYGSRPYLSRGIAILVLYASVAAVAVGVGFLVVPDAIDEINEFSDSLPDTIDSARERLQDWYDEYIPAEHHDRVDQWLEDLGNAAGDWAVGLAPRAAGFIGSTFAILIGYLTIPVWLFYTLKDHPRGVRSFIGMFPPDWRHDVRNVLGIIDAVFKNYIRAMLLQGLLVGAMSYVALDLLDVNYPIGLAIIAGITEMIPIIGPIIGAIPAVLVALAQDPVKALWVALAFLAIQQIENNFIVPKIQGDFLRLHPGVIIVLLVLAGALGGFIFVVLIVPLAAMIRDMYQYAYLRLGDVPPDPALDRAIGEYGAKALRERLVLEQVVPVAELGNPGFGRESVPPPPPDAIPGDGALPVTTDPGIGPDDVSHDTEPAPPKRRLRFVPGRKD